MFSTQRKRFRAFIAILCVVLSLRSLVPPVRTARKLTSDDLCELRPSVEPPVGTIPIFTASYPGSGSKMTWNLIEALTGFWTGDDWFLNGRKKNVVSTKTHYPHHAGRKVPFEADIQRALLLIRHPMDAIPSYHNYCYEVENSFRRHSTRAPVDVWIPWRDLHFEYELHIWKETIIYWMDAFQPNDRLVMFYEDIVEDTSGPSETLRLSDFLARTDSVKPVGEERAECVWHAIVKYHEHMAVQNNIEKTETNIIPNSPRLGARYIPRPPIINRALRKPLELARRLDVVEQVQIDGSLPLEQQQVLEPHTLEQIQPDGSTPLEQQPELETSILDQVQSNGSPPLEQQNEFETSTLVQAKSIDRSSPYKGKSTDYLHPISPFDQQSEFKTPTLEQVQPDGSPPLEQQSELDSPILEQIQPSGLPPLEEQQVLEAPILEQVQPDGLPPLEQQSELDSPILEQIQPSGLPLLEEQQVLEAPILEQAQPDGSPPLEQQSELDSPILQQIQPGGLPSVEEQEVLEAPILEQTQPDGSPSLEQQQVLEAPILQQIQPGGLPSLEEQEVLEAPILQQVQTDGSPPFQQQQVLETPIVQPVQPDGSLPLERHHVFYQPNPASFRSGPTDKPFTREQHEQVLNVLRDLQDRYEGSELTNMFDVYVKRVLHHRK